MPPAPDHDLGRCLGRSVPEDRVGRDVPLREYTSFGIGGPADFLVAVESQAELAGVLECCRLHQAPFLIIGRGTNLLVRDGGFRGVVINLRGEFARVAVDDRSGVVEAGAAVVLSDLSRECGSKGLTGLEFAVGIPGTVGGAVIMNAGAYGGEMSQVVASATLLRPDDPCLAVNLGAGELEFGYRTSRPQREGLIVLHARLQLRQGDPQAIREREEANTSKRRDKQPLDLPSAGSAFKRPPGHYTGALIEAAGMRGARVGDAQVSDKHAGFIVNLGSASARDVLDLIERVRQAVHKHSGVWLEPEIRVIGDDPA